MKRLVTLFIVLPLAVVVLAEALGNRQPVTVYLHPFSGGDIPEMKFDVPLYLVMLVTLMVGVMIGGVATWLEQGKYRVAARRARAEVHRLTAEAARTAARASGEKRK